MRPKGELRKKPRFREELARSLDYMGHDLERAADELRRKLARNLRSAGPTIARAGETAARDLWYRADHIDESLRREGKRPSRPPPAPRNTRPGY